MGDKATMVQRMLRETMMLETDPPPGICCYPKAEDITELEAIVQGAKDTPYENGIFKLDISIPDRYPFEPPKVKFQTRIYHPNIDSEGRICLDTLKEGKKGAWKPSQNIKTLLLTIQLLLSHPNPDDPLVVEISNEFKNDYPRFVERAKLYTAKYATGEQTPTTDIPEPTSKLPQGNQIGLEEKLSQEKPEKANSKQTTTRVSLSKQSKSSENLPEDSPKPKETKPNNSQPTKKREREPKDAEDLSEDQNQFNSIETKTKTDEMKDFELDSEENEELETKPKIESKPKLMLSKGPPKKKLMLSKSKK